ncbi:MAG: UDP-N-acetylmuramoylalanyl-D-glutamyl-2, 6-diaminopimelate--D-alanyl-D-alanine ligase, partial [Gammaproteobacteria bacterium]
FAVIEMGANHQGEIAYLSAITRPQVAMITNAGDAHLQGFGGLDGVAKGKGELFASLHAGDTAVVNIDDHYADYWRGLLADGVKVMTFSRSNDKADVFAEDISVDGSKFVLKAKGKQVDINLPTLGRHQVMNALGSAACALALNVSLHHISKGLAQFEGAKGRLQKIPCGQLNLIDDSYNASPASMRAAAELVAVQPGYRIMVLGAMAELGEDSHHLHCQLGKELADKADAFYCLGDKMQSFVSTNDKAMHFAELPALIKALVRQLNHNPTATVLVKGSRSMKMERVVDELLSRALKQQ